MTARSPRPLDEALRSLEAFARNVAAGVPFDDSELAHTLDELSGGTPSPQVHKLIAVLRSTPSADARRFFHATRALATGFRADAA